MIDAFLADAKIGNEIFWSIPKITGYDSDNKPIVGKEQFSGVVTSMTRFDNGRSPAIRFTVAGNDRVFNSAVNMHIWINA